MNGERVERVSTAGNTPSPRNCRPRKQHQPNPDTKGPPCKVIVTGFPEYTQQQDLIHVFSKFGRLKVDRLTDQFAQFTFEHAEDAKTAIDNSMKVNIYGEFLKVKQCKFTPKTPPKREFTQTKLKSAAVDPRSIELSGPLGGQVARVVASVRLTQDEVRRLGALYADLEAALQQLWPGCKAIPFGSITTGLGVKSSDADCFIRLAAPPQQPSATHGHVSKAQKLLRQHPQRFAEIVSIPRANTPIVKFFHVPTSTNCDVTFKSRLGARNSSLLAFLLHADSRLVPAAIVLKYWAKVHDLTGTGKLTNYALALMLLFYLQQPPLGILPAVEALQQGAAEDLVDHWDTGYEADARLLPELSPDASAAPVEDLIGGFFEYYARFDFARMVVCPFAGRPLEKEAFKEPERLPACFDRYRANVSRLLASPLRFTTSVVVQDPFEQSHNVASAITSRMAADLGAYFKFAAAAFAADRPAFLRTVLLEAPKIARGRGAPQFRVRLHPRTFAGVADAEARTLARDLLLLIFGKLLKLRLEKVDQVAKDEDDKEKEREDGDVKEKGQRKEKERYKGTVTKSIWKRKQLSKLYNLMSFGWEEKQARITEEILATDKGATDVQFQLTTTYYCHSKSLVLNLSLADGEVERFREFGKFLIAVLPDWFTRLMRPYNSRSALPKDEVTAEPIEDGDSGESAAA